VCDDTGSLAADTTCNHITAAIEIGRPSTGSYAKATELLPTLRAGLKPFKHCTLSSHARRGNDDHQ